MAASLIYVSSEFVGSPSPSQQLLVVLGEAPGEKETQLRRPFVGRSGTLLRNTLNKININDYYITNVVKVRPENNRTPTLEEIESWLPHLKMEFDFLQSKFPSVKIVAFGKTASKAVDLLNKIYYNQLQIKFGSVWHPAYVVRTHKNQQWEQMITSYIYFDVQSTQNSSEENK